MIKTWRREFYPENQDKVEQTPQKSHLIAICVLWHPTSNHVSWTWMDRQTHTHTHIHADTQMKLKTKRNPNS